VKYALKYLKRREVGGAVELVVETEAYFTCIKRTNVLFPSRTVSIGHYDCLFLDGV